MGCLKKIIGMAIFIVILFAFFAFGGYTFLKDKYDSYTSPQRAVFVEEEKDFGDLTMVSADYSLSRSLNFLGYRKLNVFYLPKKQRITILDLNSADFIKEEDFTNNTLENKIKEFSSKILNSPFVPIENITILEKGTIKAGEVNIPYADFEAEIKNIPLIKVNGTIALYKTKNRENIKDKIKKSDGITSKLLLSTKFLSGYDGAATKKFISQIKL